MNKYIILAVLLWLLPACNSSDAPNAPSEVKEELPLPKIIVKVPKGSLVWDESYHPSKGNLRALTGVPMQSSNEFFAMSDKSYVGRIAPKRTLEDLSLGDFGAAEEGFSTPSDPLVLTITIPGYFFDEIPKGSYSNMCQAVRRAVHSPDFEGTQLEGFEYDYKSFTAYNELRVAFGANINVMNVFKTSGSGVGSHIKKKTGLFAHLVQKNLSVISDYPDDGNIFLDNSLYFRYRDSIPVYVSTVTFGRTAIIAIESDYSYDEVRLAFKASLALAGANANATLDSKSMTVLEHSDIHMIFSGGQGNHIAKVANKLSDFISFIKSGAKFSKRDFGVPISFTANYVRNNGTCEVSYVAE